MQAVRVCRAATEAYVSGRIFFLKRLFFFHLVGRFCETPFECRLMQRRLTQTPYNCSISRSWATRDTDAALARRRVTAAE